MIVAYVRVSTILQNEARQLALLENERYDKLFMDKMSGKDMKTRPALQEMLGFVREGDIIICHSIDRMARSHKDLFEILNTCKDKGVQVRFIKENLDTSQGIMAEMIISILGFIAQMELERIKERQREGIEISKQKGLTKWGRPKVWDKIDTGAFWNYYKAHNGNLTKVAKSLGVGRNSLYKWIEANNAFATCSNTLEKK